VFSDAEAIEEVVGLDLSRVVELEADD